MTFEELKELSDYSNRNVKRFIKDLESTYDKMLALFKDAKSYSRYAFRSG
ncbi:MAG: hypothetical protein ACRC7S_11245 [Cetobacterium sp.]